MSLFSKLFNKNLKEETNMTQIEKALELINTFATGDTKKAEALLAKGYIQHNLSYGTGREAFVGSVAYLASAPVKTTVKIFVHLKMEIKYFFIQFTTSQEQANRLHLIFSALIAKEKLQNTGIILQQKLSQIRLGVHRLTMYLK